MKLFFFFFTFSKKFLFYFANMTNEKEEIEILTQQIIKEIDDKPENTIKIFESILLGDQQNTISFDEYLQQLQMTQKKCTCQSSWTHSQLVINCLDCQKTKNACICVKCFLKRKPSGAQNFNITSRFSIL